MPRQKKEPVEKGVIPSQDTPARFRMGEMGNLGIPIFSGVSVDELKGELNFPRSKQTFKEMSYHASINAPLTLYDNIIGKITWTFKPPVDATEEEKNRCKIVSSMMHDMEQPWAEFIRDTLTSLIYGFSVHEIVYRYRTNANGSLYNDNLIGWKKLPIRAQESIEKFVFSPNGNDIIGVMQNLTLVQDVYNRFSNLGNPQIVLPKSKFLLFRAGKHRGDPYGKSPLRDAYLAGRYLSALEDIEATGVAKDLTGFPVLHLPMEYLSESASPSQKAFREYCENSIRNIHSGAQAGMVMPVAFDDQSKQPLFKMELLSTDGKRGFDIDKVKTYYKNLIAIVFSSDVQQMGQTATGSFALGAIKNSMAGSYAERICDTIVEVLNNDLARRLYEMNNWPLDRMGTFDYDGLDNTDLDTLGKFLQRTSSVGLVEKDRAVLNAVRQGIGIDPLPEDLEPQLDLITPETSRASEGLATPFEGTRTSNGTGNDNDNNLDNAA